MGDSFIDFYLTEIMQINLCISKDVSNENWFHFLDHPVERVSAKRKTLHFRSKVQTYSLCIEAFRYWL